MRKYNKYFLSPVLTIDFLYQEYIINKKSIHQVAQNAYEILKKKSNKTINNL